MSVHRGPLSRRIDLVGCSHTMILNAESGRSAVRPPLTTGFAILSPPSLVGFVGILVQGALGSATAIPAILRFQQVRYLTSFDTPARLAFSGP
jgi:hypothetical protein